MKQCNRIALTSLFLLAGSLTGLLTASASTDSGPILLPKINQPPQRLFTKITFGAGAGDRKSVLTQRGGSGIWANGIWTGTETKEAISQFTINYISSPGVRNSQYNFSYIIHYRNPLPEVIVTKHLPFTIGDTLPVTAPSPFLPVIIDASKLKWAAGPADKGLLQIKWAIIKKEGRNFFWAFDGVLSAQKTQESDIFMTTEDENAKFMISFVCVSNGNKSNIKWADNGKDLRALTSGPHIVLPQPACPE